MPTGAWSRIAEFFDWQGWSAWFGELDRVFVFLLLPFVIALIGLWAALTGRRDGEPGDRS